MLGELSRYLVLSSKSKCFEEGAGLTLSLVEFNAFYGHEAQIFSNYLCTTCFLTEYPGLRHVRALVLITISTKTPSMR
jgi:hypothetical protein